MRSFVVAVLCVCVWGGGGGDSVAIGILSPSPPTSITPSPFSPSLISRTVSVDVKHHVYLAGSLTTR